MAIRGACLETTARVALERTAARRTGCHALARGIAGGLWRVRSRGTFFGCADLTDGILLARSAAIARPIGPTGRGAIVLAGSTWILGAARHLQALARRARQVAAAAGAAAATFAAHAVHALRGIALAGIGTGLSILLLAAGESSSRVLCARDAGCTIRFGGTAWLARPAAAHVREAVRELGIPAGAKAVTGLSRVEQHVARAASRHTDGVLRKQRAGAKSVAQPGRAAGASILGFAGMIGLARIDELAAPDRARLVARDARAPAGDVAAHTVGREARGALDVRRGLRAIQLESAASVHALLAGRTLGVGRAFIGALAGR